MEDSHHYTIGKRLGGWVEAGGWDRFKKQTLLSMQTLNQFKNTGASRSAYFKSLKIRDY